MQKPLVPVAAIVNRPMQLLAADTATFDKTDSGEQQLHLAKAAFTPSPNIVFSDFVEADFNGYAPIPAVAHSADWTTDPLTGAQIVELPPPELGWRWETGSAANLPQTIYGWYLTQVDDETMVGCQLFDTPIVLTAASQVIIVDRVFVRLAPGAFAGF